MQPMPIQDEEEDFGIPLDANVDYGTSEDPEEIQPKVVKPEDDWESRSINMNEYKGSEEDKESTWMDSLKEAGLQSAAGLGQAFTYPLDILKIAMVGEGLTDIDELESAFEKAGKPFNRDKYVQNVMEMGEFIPTQALLERTIDKYAGTNIEHPKTRTGKFFNKLFFLGGLLRGKGLGKAAKSGVAGATTTAALREAGAPEFVSELAGDVTGGVATLERKARQFSPEAQKIIDLSEKHGLPLMEFMIEDTSGSSAKITASRKAAFEKELGMSTQEAITKIIEEKIPISKLRAEGKDLHVLEEEAYEKATTLAKENPTVVNTEELVGDIDREIARIKAGSPSPSNAEKAAINVLENEKQALTNAPKKAKSEILGPDGKPVNPVSDKRTPKETSVEQLIEQTRKYNSNVKGIYKKPEFSGSEDEVRQAYAFLNDRIRNTVERQAGKEVVEAHRAANIIFGQNASLARTEGLISKSFKNDQFSAKKLNQLLNSRQGAILRRDIGEEGVKELRQIAEYGEKAQKSTTQFANSAKHKFKVGDWGPLAGFVLAKAPPVGVAAAAAKPIWDYTKGYLLTRPVARKTYANILKNAANGSFSNMAKDFATLESEVVKEFGSVEDFMKQGIQELQFYRDDED